ncbi:Flp pilus assembly protein CpaB [Candidatus Leptofilum sp.]|uniref:Flp pilus assembly protein CpaB n=1 Tax=Candidatus Leptofilum sp. TaxID=3241576 RepID=UPI003B59C404
MRLRTFILLILVLILIAAVALLLLGNSGIGPLAGLLGGNDDTPAENGTTDNGDDDNGAEEPLQPPPTATPGLEDVVVARVNIPVGTMITDELLEVQRWPRDNIALQGGYTFTDTTQLVGRITKVDIARGQSFLSPMLALNPTDIASFGSDLALYVPFGEVAIAFPVDRFNGAALAMRPGDLVDVLMTMRVVDIDPQFGTILPNNVARVINSALLNGQPFLFPEVKDGRLEFVPEINQVAAIYPSTLGLEGQDFTLGLPIPKRVTQLTIQQAEVLYVGTWQDPRILEQEQIAARAAAQPGEDGSVPPTPTPIPSRLEGQPDVVILSMSSQDALALNWAMFRGVDIDLALRSPGDQTAFVTTSVSLPQIIDQGGLAIPDQSNFDLHPSMDNAPYLALPPENPNEPEE